MSIAAALPNVVVDAVRLSTSCRGDGRTAGEICCNLGGPPGGTISLEIAFVERASTSASCGATTYTVAMRGFSFVALAAFLFFAPTARAAEHRVTSPGGGLTAVVSDDGGLRYRVEVGGQATVIASPLGLEFKDGTKLGPSAVVTSVTTAAHDGAWRNDFGNRRRVPDRWREARLVLTERSDGAREKAFGLIVRAYDDGVALRYDLPKGSGLGR